MLLCVCVIVWGSNFIFGKILVEVFSPTLLTMLRLLFIVLFLASLTLLKKQFNRINKSDLPSIIFLGIVGVFINQWSFFKGLQTADTTISALIIATAPILTGFLAATFLKEKLTVQTLGGSVVAIIGIYFVVAAGESASLHFDIGLLWIFVTMVTFSIMIIMTRFLSQRIDPLLITLYTNIVGFIVSVPFVFVFERPIQMNGQIADWVLLIVSAVVVHGMANLMWNQNIRYVDAAKASILSNLEPFVAMIMGFILLHKPITTIEIIGSFFIVGGVIFSTYQRKKGIIISENHT